MFSRLVLGTGTVVFDLFKVWRLDSGDYERIAEVVMCGWDSRCEQAKKLGAQPPARPLLMHSNLSSADEVVHVCRCAPASVTDELSLLFSRSETRCSFLLRPDELSHEVTRVVHSLCR